MGDPQPAPYSPRRPPRHGAFELAEGRMAYTAWGPESADPVLLLHGWMDCGAAFQLLADELPDDWPLLAIDWLGHGHSARRAGRYWFGDRLAELDALLAHRYPQGRARIIGHSMGGTVAMMHAGIRPDRTRWLVNIEGYGVADRGPEATRAQLRDWLATLSLGRRPRLYRDTRQLASALRLRNPRLDESAALFLAGAWTRPLDDGQVEILSDPLAELRSPMRFHRHELEACWDGIDAPVLLLNGAESDYLQRAAGDGALERWLARHSFLQSVTIPASGHLLPHEQPAAVAAEVVRFAGSDDAGPQG